MALTIIDSNALFNSYNQSKYSNKLLESAWQFEIYRAISKCLPKGIYISPEVGRIFCQGGFVDLYIPTYKWAIELLIE
ncbi:1703_t:CDS:1, partial [Funneliformis geosporum]